MTNRPKAKGTGGETELRKKLEELGVPTRRTSAGCRWDLEKVSTSPLETDTLEVLATRPDHGRWLVTLSLEDFASLYLGDYYPTLHIESKRYARFAHHTLFENEIGRPA
jgi:hypothetical protein